MSHAQDGESVRRSAVAGVDSVEHAWLADRAAIEALARSGAFLVPTLVVTDVNRTLPGLTPVQRERQDLIERRHRASTEAAIELGIPIATGTDTGEVGVTADMVCARDRLAARSRRASPMAAIKAATIGRPRACSASTARRVGSRRAISPISCWSKATRWPTSVGSRPSPVFQVRRSRAAGQRRRYPGISGSGPRHRSSSSVAKRP